MKIRIKDNTVRFRLTQSEVSRLSEENKIASTTEFLTGNFVYEISSTAEADFLATFKQNKIQVQIPQEKLKDFCSTQIIGIEGNSGKVKILIEKDFVCLDNSAEDQSDNYPNPNSVC